MREGSSDPFQNSEGRQEMTMEVISEKRDAAQGVTQSKIDSALQRAEVETELATTATSNNTPVHEESRGKETQPKRGNSWAEMVKGPQHRLKKSGEPFLLETGEPCIRIPNTLIERNRKDWECFILGQFYSPPPSQGIVHNVVNGIWSRSYRDVVVSKMEGNAYLFRIPSQATRNRVLTQRLWQIDGQTMFVAKWEPGVVPTKPELSSAPIWLELRNVPLQFFNEEGLEQIASMVGAPKFLHPQTANKTNLEVARVFTVIDHAFHFRRQ